MPITQEQALELADKYISYMGNFALRDNIKVINKSAEGWNIVAKTTPMISGMPTEIMRFPIDAETGEVGGCQIVTVPNIPVILKEIDERKDLDEPKKEQVKAKVKEVEEEAKKEPMKKY